MKQLILTLGFLFVFSLPLMAQCPKTMPAGTLCITQVDANRAAQIARESAAKDAKIVVLENGLKTKDEEISLIKTKRDENEAKLIQTIHDTENKFSFANGQLTQCQAAEVKDSALIEYLVKNQRSKQQGVFNIKLGGN